MPPHVIHFQRALSTEGQRLLAIPADSPEEVYRRLGKSSSMSSLSSGSTEHSSNNMSTSSSGDLSGEVDDYSFQFVEGRCEHIRDRRMPVHHSTIQDLMDAITSTRKELEQQLEQQKLALTARITALEEHNIVLAQEKADLSQETAKQQQVLLTHELASRLEQSALSLGLQEDISWAQDDLVSAQEKYTRIQPAQSLLVKIHHNQITPAQISPKPQQDARVAEQAAYALSTARGEAYLKLAQEFANLKQSTSQSRLNAAHPKPTMDQMRIVVGTALHTAPADVRRLLAGTPQATGLLEDQLAMQEVAYKRIRGPCVEPSSS